MSIAGIIVPMVTPLNHDATVDTVALQACLRWVVRSGVQGILIGGSMGEYPNLTEKERIKVLEKTCETVEAGTVLIANISDTAEHRVLHNMNLVKDFPVDAYIVTPPFYFTHSWQELQGFFLRIADQADRPVFLYNIPEFVGNRLPATLVLSLAQHPRIMGIKDSSGDFVQLSTIVFEKPENFLVFQGCTEASLPALLIGCDGLISGLSNVLPDTFVRLFSLVKARNVEEAKTLQKCINRVNRVFAQYGFLAATKYALSYLGLCLPYVTKPFLEVSEEGKRAIEEILQVCMRGEAREGGC